LERQIEAAEAALAAIEDELADPAAWDGSEVSARSSQRHEQAKRAVEQLYAEWENVAG
jgi:ATP-binding cassette subfamily F protein 3